MSDDPFGDDGRTVIRPNPGGRRALPAAPTGAPPNSAPPAYAPARPASSVDPNFSRQPSDNWQVPPPQYGNFAAPAPPPRSAFITRSEMIVPHQNPIMRAAGPMLLLLGRLRIALMRASPAELMETVADSVEAFEADVRAARVPDSEVTAAKYVLCVTADDIVQNIPAEDQHVWTQYSMESRFFRSRVGGEDFFKILNGAIGDPTHRASLLELQHACLALGFQGVYRHLAGGQATLQNLQRQVYEVLKGVMQRAAEEISPHWRGIELRSRNGQVRVPFWAVAVFCLAGLAALYFTYLTLLDGRADALASDIAGLHKPVQISLARKEPAPPPPPPPQPPPPPPPEPGQPVRLTQLQRIRAALAPEIAAGEVSADAVGVHIIIRVGNALLFDSGKANVKPEFKALAVRIAKMLEGEVGPIMIIGHTDNTPVRTAHFKNNYELSVVRAKTVADIVKAGLTDPSRIQTQGRGEEDPVEQNDSEQHKAKNRRVELWIDRVD